MNLRRSHIDGNCIPIFRIWFQSGWSLLYMILDCTCRTEKDNIILCAAVFITQIWNINTSTSISEKQLIKSMTCTSFSYKIIYNIFYFCKLQVSISLIFYCFFKSNSQAPPILWLSPFLHDQFSALPFIEKDFFLWFNPSSYDVVATSFPAKLNTK